MLEYYNKLSFKALHDEKTKVLSMMADIAKNKIGNKYNAIALRNQSHILYLIYKAIYDKSKLN